MSAFDIHYGQIILGMLHGYGYAMTEPPINGSLYINARDIVENEYCSGISDFSKPLVSHAKGSASVEEVEALLAHVESMGISQVVLDIVKGALYWLTDPVPSDLLHLVEWRGAIVANEVMNHQIKVDCAITYQLAPHILIDQTELSDQVLGLAPRDARYCWLVTRFLKGLLMAEHEVVHSIGATYWWQQARPLNHDELHDNIILQRIANRHLVVKAWNPS